MKPLVYIETTIVSYLAARPSRNLIAASRQQLTADWWEISASAFSLCTSDLVHDEINRGDALAVSRRRRILKGIHCLELSAAVERLARALIQAKALPPTAAEDAAHIAVAAIHGVPFILTWNFRHIANGHMMEKIRTVCSQAGHALPTICTPEQLMGTEL